MPWLEDPLRTCWLALARDPLLGAWLALAVAATLPACGLALVLEARRRHAGKAPALALATLPPAPLAVAWLTLVAAVEQARAATIERALSDPRFALRPAAHLFRYVHEQGLVWALCAGSWLVLPLVAITEWRVLAARERRPGPLRSSIVVLLGTLAAAVTLAEPLRGPLAALAGGRGALAREASGLPRPHLVVVVLGAVSVALVLAQLARPRWRAAAASPGATRLALGILALGLLSFAATWGRFVDSAEPLRLDRIAEQPAPESHRCRPRHGETERAGDTWLVLRDRGASLDGAPVTPAALGARLDALRERSHDARPREIGVFARPGLRLSVYLPWLEALHARRGVGVRAIVRTLAPRSTATLGVVLLRRYCGHEVRLADDGAPLTRFPTWGVLARAAEEARGIHVAVPPRRGPRAPGPAGAGAPVPRLVR